MYQGTPAEKAAIKDYYNLMVLVNTRTQIDDFDQRSSQVYEKISQFLNGDSERYSGGIKAAGILNLVKIKQGIMAALPEITTPSLAIREVEAADKIVKNMISELEKKLLQPAKRN